MQVQEELQMERMSKVKDSKNIFELTNNAMINLKAREAKEIIDCLVKNETDRKTFQVAWKMVEYYADIYNKEYINYMSNIPDNTLNVLYKTMKIENLNGKQYCPCVYIIKNLSTGKYKIGSIQSI